MSFSDNRMRLTSDPLGRYYTREFVGSALIDALSQSHPKTVVDLGSGGGALSLAAQSRWEAADIITVDIEETPQIFRKGALTGSHRHVTADALRFDLPELIGLPLGKADIALSNPPYITPNWRPGFKKILSEAGIPISYKAMPEITAAILFIAQNLRLLRTGGQAGLIVPDGLICGDKFREVRQALVSENHIRKVIKLPRNAFSRTDAQAHIIILEKGASKEGGICLQQLTEDGSLTRAIYVDESEGVDRLDYDFHSNKRKLKKSPKSENKKMVSLSSLATLHRGSINNTFARENNIPVFHTSDIKSPCETNLDGRKKLPAQLLNSGMLMAEKGDVVIGRVGRNLSSKVSIVTSGKALVSDCIFVIRAPKKYQKLIYKSLTSIEGKIWLQTISHGVGAKHITKSDLESFPIYLPDNIDE